MLRISKLTDYGIVCLAHFAREPSGTVLSAREVAVGTGIPAPTVSKLFRCLTRGGLLVSQRGVAGGYSLSRPPALNDVSAIVTVLEGPVSVTECSDPVAQACDNELTCPLRDHWPQINIAIRAALSSVSLADLITPVPAGRSSLPTGSHRANGASTIHTGAGE